LKNVCAKYNMVLRTKRVVRRRKAPVRRVRRRNPLLRGLGGFNINRRYDPIYITNGLINGVPENSNPGIISLGTPELNTTFGNDIYNLPFAMNFDLKNLAQYTDITSICDRYKIVGATVKISYNANQAWGSTAGSTGGGYYQGACMPLVNFIQDYDDDGVVPTAQFRAKMGIKQRVFKGGNDLVTMTVAPRPATSVYDSAFAVPNRSMWINTGYTSVAHYGIKGYFQNVPLGSNQQYASAFTIDVTLNVACKDLQ